MSSSTAKGKGKAVEHSSSDEESMQMETTKKRRMDFKVRARQLLPVKYVNFRAFPATSFDFPTLLRYQRIDKFVSDCGNYYNDLVKAFLHKFSVSMNMEEEHILKATVRTFVLEENLSTIAANLEIPSSGYFLRKGVNHVEGPWANYEKMEYYYQICRFPKETIVGNQRNARMLCYSKNLSISDRMLHYIISYVLIPKDSNHAQINDLEMQMLFAIKNKIRIDWILTIMYHLQQQLSLSTRLPYARLISRILEMTNLDLNREPCTKMRSTANEINEITIVKNTGIIKDSNGTFRYADEDQAAN